MANGPAHAIHIDTLIDEQGRSWITIETNGPVTMPSDDFRAWLGEAGKAPTIVEGDALLLGQMIEHDVAPAEAAGWIRHLRDVRQNDNDGNPGRS